MKIYTRTGDSGETGLFGTRVRVPKDDARVEAYGTVDELNCTLGAVRATLDDLAFALSPAVGRAEAGGLRGGSYVAGGWGVRLRALQAVPGVRLSGRLPRLHVTGLVRGTLRLAGGRLHGRLGGRAVSLDVRGTPAADLVERRADAAAARRRPT